MTTGERMKMLRREQGIQIERIASAMGVSVASVYRYENGDIEKVPGKMLEPLAAILGTTPAYLMGWDDEPLKLHKFAPNITEDIVTFPVITSVAAHYDSIASDESLTGDTIDMPVCYLRGRKRADFCVMRVKGDSMYPDFRDGDAVLVLLQSTLNHSGDVGVVCYGDGEMTLKRINFVKGEDWLEMIPINPAFPPKKITGVDLEVCRVIGIPKLLLREF